jgi:hypothetical protein
MPCAASRFLDDWVSEYMAALEAEYAAISGRGAKAFMEMLLTMAPRE